MLNDKTDFEYFIFVQKSLDRKSKWEVYINKPLLLDGFHLHHLIFHSQIFIFKLPIWKVMWSTFSQTGIKLQKPDSSDTLSFAA